MTIELSVEDQELFDMIDYQESCDHPEIENLFNGDDCDVTMYMCLYCGRVFDESDPHVVNRL